MLPIKQDLLTSQKNRPALRDSFYKIKKMKGVIIHWTANPFKGAGAKANRNYFNSGQRFASAHYCVDANTILQCVPDDEVAYHVGATSYRPIGQSMIEGNLTPNFYTIGIELCINIDSDWQTTYKNGVELAQHLLNKFGLTTDNLYRHFDITGKDCPKMMIEESLWEGYKEMIADQYKIHLNIPFNTWEKFKSDVNHGVDFPKPSILRKGTVNTADLNVRSGNGTEYPVVHKLKKGDNVIIYDQVGNWFRIGEDRWVSSFYVVINFQTKDAEIETSDEANVRRGPGKQYNIVDRLKDATVVQVIDLYDGWYQIGAERWVHSSLVKLVDVKTGRVNSQDPLNVRTGPGTEFDKIKTLAFGALVKIYEEKNGWCRIGTDEWVNKFFITQIA